MKHDAVRLDPAGYPWRMEFLTQFGDLDIGGHLNNVALARHHESARARFQFRIFGDPMIERGSELRSIVARVTIDYLREGRYPAPLLACAAVGHVGNSSFVYATALFQSGHCISLCEAVHVCVGADGSQPMTEAMRAALNGFRLGAVG
jgi:acyl-CoA thioester hydrolase